jgi:hypothetical protein
MLRELVAELGVEHAAELEGQRTDHAAELKQTESMIGHERQWADRRGSERDAAEAQAR